ncbi:YtxH domain-containing protein [Mesobacillus maritimus]|uniref:YtxH domain-containing protein n=1 Tax=Mesobacillus maritimus TaxID=1643336 RepID=UPI00385023F6
MNKQKGLALGTVVGAAVGATATLLVSPKSGDEVREDIGNQLTKGKNKTAEMKNELTNKLGELSEIVNESTSTVSQSVKEKCEKVMNEAAQALNKIDEKDNFGAAELKKLVRELMNEGKHASEEIREIVENELKEIEVGISEKE